MEAVPTNRTALSILVLALLATPAIAAAFSAPAAAVNGAPGVKPIGQMIHERMAHEHAFGPSHPMPSEASPLDPLDRAREELTMRDWHGRTVLDWLGVADAKRLLALRATDDAPPRDLATEVARLSALAGAPLDVAALAALEADAARVPAEARAPFARLVGAVADAYEAQAPMAIDIAAAWPTEWDEGTRLLTPEQRDLMAARADAILAAMLAFRDDVPPETFATFDGFRGPDGLVRLGTSGADVHARDGYIAHGDAIVIVDPAGDDTYLTSAGGACPDLYTLAHACNRLAVSVVLDIAGDDAYVYDGEPAAVQGAGSVGGIGMLVDLEGNDRYESTMTRAGRGPFFGYIDGGAQGFAQAGYALLLDAQGNDTYRHDVRSLQGRSIWAFAQGYGSLGGVGLALDADGADQWYSNGLGGVSGGGFQGVYNNGVGFYGGVGVQADTGSGNDVYRAYNNGTTVDYYAQGFGAFGGLGILLDDGGDDDYTAVEVATDPFIVPLLNCAFGTGSLGGAGVFLELGGDDRYYGESTSPRKAYVMNEGFGGIGAGYGTFIDISGDDGHFMVANGAAGSDTFGRGVLIEHVSPLSGINVSGNGGANRFGNYLDLGGNDVYVGAPPSRNNAQWSGGGDFDAGHTLADLLGVVP